LKPAAGTCGPCGKQKSEDGAPSGSEYPLADRVTQFASLPPLEDAASASPSGASENPKPPRQVNPDELEDEEEHEHIYPALGMYEWVLKHDPIE